MPKFLEDKLKAEASKEGLSKKRAARYVYGTLNRIGAMHGNQETAKGAAMERKHQEKMRGETHEYDHKRPKKQIQSRYK